MKFFDGIKVLKKNSTIRKELDNIIKNLPDSDVIARDLLKEINNNKTKYVFDRDIKGNYYVYLNDTIYLCDKQSEKNNYERLCVIAHECTHSIQPKILQNLNFIFSNLEMISFVLFIVLYLFKINNIYLYLIYLFISVLSIISRLILEIWAMSKAPKISKRYLENQKIKKEEVEKVYNSYKFSTRLLMPFAILQLLFFKILRFILISILSFYKF